MLKALVVLIVALAGLAIQPTAATAQCNERCEGQWEGDEHQGWACLNDGTMANCVATTTSCRTDLCVLEDALDAEGELLAVIDPCGEQAVIADAWRGFHAAGAYDTEKVKAVPATWLHRISDTATGEI